MRHNSCDETGARFTVGHSMLALAAVAALSLVGHPADTRYPDNVASIKAGHHDCPHCVLAGADLSNQCVKGGNLQGADFDNARLVLACMSHANFRNATFRRADLSGANLAGSDLGGADLTGALLSITSIKGADLARTKGLTQQQLDAACGDAQTKLPAGLNVKACD